MATRPMRFGIQTRQQLVESPQMLVPEAGARPRAGADAANLTDLRRSPIVSRTATHPFFPIDSHKALG